MRNVTWLAETPSEGGKKKTSLEGTISRWVFVVVFSLSNWGIRFGGDCGSLAVLVCSRGGRAETIA